MDSVEIGKRIKKYRLAKGLTQKQLAELMYTDDKKVSKWETGRVKMDLELITQICNALDISVHDFLDGIEYKQRFTKITKIGKFLWRNVFKIIAIILFAYFLVYYIANYNSIKFYDIKSDSIDININAGMYLESKVKSVLVLDKPKVYNIDYDILSTKLRLYTYVNGDKVYFYESDSLDSIYIKDYYGVEKYLSEKVKEGIKKGLYLTIDITDTDNEIHNYETKLDVIHNFSSNQLAYFKNKNIENKQGNENTDFEIDEVKLLKNDFKKAEETNTYVKDINKDTNVSVDLESKNIKVMIKTKSTKIIFINNYREKSYNKNLINKNNKILESYDYNYENNDNKQKLTCYIGNCESYKEDMEYILNLMNTLFK